jgi:hypothetical protein
MKERPDFGKFKKILMNNYGKDHELFAYYFEIQRKN